MKLCLLWQRRGEEGEVTGCSGDQQVAGQQPPGRRVWATISWWGGEGGPLSRWAGWGPTTSSGPTASTLLPTCATAWPSLDRYDVAITSLVHAEQNVINVSLCWGGGGGATTISLHHSRVTIYSHTIKLWRQHLRLDGLKRTSWQILPLAIVGMRPTFPVWDE